jgi:hypothetical protein
MGVSQRVVHLKMRRGKRSTSGFFGRERNRAEAKPIYGLLEPFQIGAELQQRADKHVASDTCREI